MTAYLPHRFYWIVASLARISFVFPDLVLPVLQIFDILRIDGAGLIGSFCVLIQVVAAVTEKPFSRPHVHLQLEKGIKK